MPTLNGSLSRLRCSPAAASYSLFAMATIQAEEPTVVVNAEMPAPVPTEMARSVDMEALAGEIAKCVGSWKTDHSVAVPGMPCCSITAKYVFNPLKDGVYPYEGVTKVKCCGCCPMMTEKQTVRKRRLPVIHGDYSQRRSACPYAPGHGCFEEADVQRDGPFCTRARRHDDGHRGRRGSMD